MLLLAWKAVDNFAMPREIWAAGELYEPYVGRWSRRVATAFIDWLMPSDGGRWLDVGCGTGALTTAIVARANPARVAAVDPSLPYVSYARSALPDERVVFAVANAMALPMDGNVLDHIVSGLMLNFVADPPTAIQEMRRVAVAGGTVAAYVWDYARRMQLMRYFWDAAVALDPTAEELDEGHRFTMCQPDRLEALFRSAGLSNVAVHPIEVPTVFTDFDDYWTPFLGGQAPAPSYAMALADDRRTLLRERLRAVLPTSSDGSISLVARAWAVRGRA
jgi:SAM-dependent methyltransferase